MDLLGILRIKDSNGNWVSVPGLKGDTGEPFKILGIYATAADLEAAVTDPEVSDVYLVGTTGAYDIYLYLTDGWHNTGRYMPKGDAGDPAPAESITSAVETWLAANVDPETGYVLDRSLSQENAAAPADLVGELHNAIIQLDDIISGSPYAGNAKNFVVNFITGKLYYLTNTSPSSEITINFNTYDGSQVVEDIKNGVVKGETVKFIPTQNATYLRAYSGSTGATFMVQSGDFIDLEQRVTDIEATTSNRYFTDIVFESGLYSGNPNVGDTYNPSKTSNASWECAKIPVNAKDIVSLYGSASSNTKLFVLTDTQNIVKQKTGVSSATSAKPQIINVEEDGFLYISLQKSTAHSGTIYRVDGFEYLKSEMKNYTDSEVDAIGQNVYLLNFDYDVSGIPEQSDFSITSRDPQDIYDLYDALATAYPNYVTKVDCSDADTEIEATRPSYLSGYPIYLYKFTPKIINTASAIKRRMKIMILTGVHSNEKWNIYNVYRLMKYICDNWKTDVNAETLRTLVDFYIIPLVNPWGFANAGIVENAGRCNGNGVNLNRNAPASNWTLSGQGTSDYSGASAGSEYETQIWLYYHDLLKPDVFIDQHTPGMPDSGVFGVLETDITIPYLANIGDIICRTISNNLVKIDTNVPDSADVVLFDMYSDTNPGQVTRCAREHGSKYSFLFEMSDSSKWSNGTLTSSVVTGASSGIQIREQMRSIYNGWIRLIDASAKFVGQVST